MDVIIMKRVKTASLAVLAVAALGLWAGPAAGAYRPTESDIDPEVLRMDESEYLGLKIGGHYRLVDDRGEEFTFADLRGQPRILLLSYFTCDGACPRTNSHPSRKCASGENRSVGCGKGGSRIISRLAITARNETALTAKHHPSPTAATSTPATAGPTIRPLL